MLRDQIQSCLEKTKVGDLITIQWRYPSSYPDVHFKTEPFTVPVIGHFYQMPIVGTNDIRESLAAKHSFASVPMENTHFRYYGVLTISIFKVFKIKKCRS